MAAATAVRDLIRRISSTDQRERARASDEVTDIVRSLSYEAAAGVAGALVLARQCETDVTSQEAQLNALVELCEWHPVPWQVLVGLLRLNRSTLSRSQAEHLEALLDGAEKEWDDESDLWEHQGRPLTVLDIRRALRSAPPEMPVTMELYTGAGTEPLSAVELGYSGRGIQPASALLTVTRLDG